MLSQWGHDPERIENLSTKWRLFMYSTVDAFFLQNELANKPKENIKRSGSDTVIPTSRMLPDVPQASTPQRGGPKPPLSLDVKGDIIGG